MADAGAKRCSNESSNNNVYVLTGKLCFLSLFPLILLESSGSNVNTIFPITYSLNWSPKFFCLSLTPPLCLPLPLPSRGPNNRNPLSAP